MGSCSSTRASGSSRRGPSAMGRTPSTGSQSAPCPSDVQLLIRGPVCPESPSSCLQLPLWPTSERFLVATALSLCRGCGGDRRAFPFPLDRAPHSAASSVAVFGFLSRIEAERSTSGSISGRKHRLPPGARSRTCWMGWRSDESSSGLGAESLRVRSRRPCRIGSIGTLRPFSAAAASVSPVACVGHADDRSDKPRRPASAGVGDHASRERVCAPALRPVQRSPRIEQGRDSHLGANVRTRRPNASVDTSKVAPSTLEFPR